MLQVVNYMAESFILNVSQGGEHAAEHPFQWDKFSKNIER